MSYAMHHNQPSLTCKAQIEEGSARQLVGKFDVKKRSYYGNTSMEAEISLLMANQTLVSSFFSHWNWNTEIIQGISWEIDLRSIYGYRQHGLCTYT